MACRSVQRRPIWWQITPNGISTDITIVNKKLKTVHSFKYLAAIVSDEGSKLEVVSRTAQTTTAVTKLKEHRHQLQDQTDVFPGHVHILYACENWTITANIE